MNHKIVAVILSVIDLICTEWHISDCHVKEIIGIIRLLKAFDLDIGIWIEKLSNSATDAVQFHSIEFGLV